MRRDGVPNVFVVETSNVAPLRLHDPGQSWIPCHRLKALHFARTLAPREPLDWDAFGEESDEQMERPALTILGPASTRMAPAWRAVESRDTLDGCC